MKEKNNDEMKDLYEGIIFNGRFTTSWVLRPLQGQKNKYGEWRTAEVLLKSESAKEICECIEGTDSVVAQGIAIGVELGKPTFDEYGKAFLKSHITDYKDSELGVALTKVLLGGVDSQRCSKIIQGVENVLEKRGNYTEEEKSAIGAIKVTDVTNKFEGEKRPRRATIILSKLREVCYEAGTVTMPDVYQKCLELPSEKDIVKRNPVRRKELESGYKYYAQHYDEIPMDFVSRLEGCNRNRIISYYVASREEELLHMIYEQEKNVERES